MELFDGEDDYPEPAYPPENFLDLIPSDAWDNGDDARDIPSPKVDLTKVTVTRLEIKDQSRVFPASRNLSVPSSQLLQHFDVR